MRRRAVERALPAGRAAGLRRRPEGAPREAPAEQLGAPAGGHGIGARQAPVGGAPSSTVVADQGALYHVGAAQLHAVKVTIAAASTVRGFEYWCYSPGSGAGGGGGQDLGTVAGGL